MRARARIGVALMGACIATSCWPAASAHGAYPGENGKIAFSSLRTGTFAIHVMEPGGSNQNLISSGGTNMNPVWSPNGQKIAFLSSRDDPNFEIYVANADGSNPVRVTTDSQFESSHTWSPDGSEIAFTSTRDGGGIFVMTAAGTGVTKIPGTTVTDTDVAWSPDGQKLAFARTVSGNQEIFSINVNGSGATNLTNAAGTDAHPDWSPNGQKIVFESVRGGDSSLWTMDSTGQNQEELADGPDGSSNAFPVWSPDGTKVAFTRGFASEDKTDDDIYVVDANGSNPLQLTSSTAHDDWPDWQPLPSCDVSGASTADVAEPAPAARRAPARPRAPMKVWRRAEVAEVAEAASQPKVSRIDPGAAVPGAAVVVRGSGLSGKGTRVTIGGRAAKILKAASNQLRVLVPKARAGSQKLVVKRGRHAASARLRVLRPFRGTIKATPDAKRARGATVGPAGGTVAATGADGTRYELAIPPGALIKDEQIGVAPVLRFSGLPFSGTALGAQLTPDGLTFATPATLTITSKKPIPAASVGFGYGNSTKVLEVQRPAGSGRARTLSISHFSSGAVTPTNPADFANAVAPLLVEQPMREDTIATVMNLIAVYEATFGALFCQSQPACGDAQQKSLDSLRTRIQSRCTDASVTTMPGISAARDLVRMEAVRRELGATDDLSFTCRKSILKLIYEPARDAVCAEGANPLGFRALIVNPRLEEAGTSDFDQDGEVTHLEFLFFISGEVADAGLDDLRIEGQACFFRALDAIPDRGKAICESDPQTAERDLNRGLRYAQRLGHGLQPFIDALDFCRLGVSVTPGSVTLLPGAQQQFTATVAGVFDDEASGLVTWSATGGAITSGGLYTAPDTPGTYQVRATSTRNSNRSGVATVNVEGCVQQ